MRRTLGLATTIVAAATAITMSAPPASATVHEIVGQWCAGHHELAPPGISGGSSSENIARPLAASGVVTLTPYLDSVLIDIDFDHPAVKVVATGTPQELFPGGPYAYPLQPEGPFTRCRNLRP